MKVVIVLACFVAFAAALPVFNYEPLVRTLPVAAYVDDDLNASADSDEYFAGYNRGYYGNNPSYGNYNRGYGNYNRGYGNYPGYASNYGSYSGYVNSNGYNNGYRYKRDLETAESRKKYTGHRRGYGGEQGPGHGGSYNNNRKSPNSG